MVATERNINMRGSSPLDHNEETSPASFHFNLDLATHCPIFPLIPILIFLLHLPAHHVHGNQGVLPTRQLPLSER